MSQFDRSKLVSLADLCYQNGLYNDAIGYMKEVIQLGAPLNYEERLTIFWSYNMLKRPFYDILYSCKDLNLNNYIRIELLTKAATAINRICDEAIELFNTCWIKRDDSKEAVADYKTYVALQYEDKVGCALTEEYKQKRLNKALKLYEEAWKIANENLNPAHPVRLMQAYHFSDCSYYLNNSVDKALAFAKEAYEKGLLFLPELSEELKHGAEQLLECLKENIDKWS